MSSISLYPLWLLFRYFCEHELNTTRQEIAKMKENILYMSQFAPGGRDSISWPIGMCILSGFCACSITNNTISMCVHLLTLCLY